MKQINRHGIVAANMSYKSYTENPEYFCIEALEDGLTAKLSTNACEYRIDDGSWNNLSADTNTPSVNKGQKISFKITNPTISMIIGIGTFTISKRCNIEGNIMSLLYGDDFIGQNDLSGKNYTFYNLFKNCTTLQSAENLILPATILVDDCYYGMFYGCISLTTAPELPATTLASFCYASMFRGCTSLTTSPELPATTLADRCYEYMFYGCTSLTTAPELPATTLIKSCYSAMFYGCTSLTKAPELPATTLPYSCYDRMFYGCKNLTTAPELPATTLAERCYFSMFSYCTSLVTAPKLPVTKLASNCSNCYQFMFDGCTSLTTAPELPATTLASGCYQYMFRGCTSLTTAPELPATILADNCYQFMFDGCTSLTTAPELPATTLASGCYSSMFEDCTSLTTAPELPATTLASSCYNSMFFGCTSLVTAPEVLPATTLASSCYYGMFCGCSIIESPELPATTLASNCYEEMFFGCTRLTAAPELPATTLASNCYSMMFSSCSSLTTAPELPATTLASNCYSMMFSDCHKLNYIKMLATDISASSCLSSWVSGVASNGTFVKHPDMTTLPSGSSGIPRGWTVKDNITLLDCISLEISADDVNGRDTNTTIYYTAQVNALDEYGNQLVITKTGSAISEEFPQNTSETESINRTITFTYMGVTATTIITQGVWVNQSYTIMLNDQWQLSDKPNPDASLYDGVYESFSNKGVNSKAAIMYIDIVGYTDFDLYIRSYAEGSFDYVMVSQLDKDINNDTSYSNTTLVKAHTRSKQTSGTSISNYTHVQFTGIDGGEHRITIVYRKDSSSASGDDKGYVLIKK